MLRRFGVSVNEKNASTATQSTKPIRRHRHLAFADAPPHSGRHMVVWSDAKHTLSLVPRWLQRTEEARCSRGLKVLLQPACHPPRQYTQDYRLAKRCVLSGCMSLKQPPQRYDYSCGKNNKQLLKVVAAFFFNLLFSEVTHTSVCCQLFVPCSQLWKG